MQALPTHSLLESMISPVGSLKRGFIHNLLELKTDTPSNTELGIVWDWGKGSTLFILRVVGYCVITCQ